MTISYKLITISYKLVEQERSAILRRKRPLRYVVSAVTGTSSIAPQPAYGAFSTSGDPGTSQTNSQESPGNGPLLSWDPRVGDDGNAAPYRLLCPARVARPHRAVLHWGRSWRGVRRGWDHPNRDLPRPPPPPMSRRAEPCRPTSSPTTRPGRKQLNATRTRRPRGEPSHKHSRRCLSEVTCSLSIQYRSHRPTACMMPAQDGDCRLSCIWHHKIPDADLECPATAASQSKPAFRVSRP